jgi:hypothetical protein
MAWRPFRWSLALVGGASVAIQLRKLRARIRALEALAGVLAGHADAARTPFELLQQAAQVTDWWQIAEGGDTSAGAIDNLDSCPCQHTYTVATTTLVLNAWPNPNPNPVVGFPWNAPPRAPADLRCSGTCVQVCTKVWRGWSVVKERTTGKLQMNICTFAQYHCKEPTDPDKDKKPDGEELPPKPGEITP